VILAVDFGERRIGLALSDPLAIVARPYRTLDTRETPDPFKAIADIVRLENAGRVLVGYPYRLNGSAGTKAKAVDRFIDRLEAVLGNVPVERVDERYSSVEAQEILNKRKQKRRGNKADVDRFAAAVFLQDYLNERTGKAT
jgi:putative Holliday junction resolvase